MPDRVIASQRTIALPRSVAIPRGLASARGFTGVPSFLPTDVSDLSGWYAARLETAYADLDRVGSVTNQASIGPTLNTQTGGNRPVYRTGIINGEPVFRMSGNLEFMQGSDPAIAGWSQSPFTVFGVFNPGAVAEEDVICDDRSGSGHMLLLVFTGLLRGHAWRGANANAIDSAGGSIVAGTTYIMTQRVTATTIEIRINGVLVAGPTALVGSASGSFDEFSLGGASGRAASRVDGDIPEGIMYMRDLDDTEIDDVEGFLNGFYAAF